MGQGAIVFSFVPFLSVVQQMHFSDSVDRYDSSIGPVCFHENLSLQILVVSSPQDLIVPQTQSREVHTEFIVG